MDIFRPKSPSRSRIVRSLVLAVSTFLLAAPTTATAATPTTVVVAPGGVHMKGAMEALRPGDTLALKPGTYDIGYIRPVLARGTKTQPITVRAADPKRPPLLRGGLHLTSPDFWKIENLRIQATAAKAPALHVIGGNGWSVTGGEYFGARSTNAYANVAISGANGYPRAFRFAGNCVHDAARSTRVKTDHNIYVNFAGAAGSSGTIEHNTIYGHPNGAGIKLGDGGEPGARGPWGVLVENNTITHGGRQVLMSRDVRNNRVRGNLLGASTEPFTATDKRTTGIYALFVEGTGNVLEHNYVFGASMAHRDPNGLVKVGADVAVRPDPALTRASTCTSEPGYWKARYYGTTSTNVYQRW